MSNIHDLSKIEVHTIETVEDALEFQRWLGNRRDFLAVDIETSGLTFWSDVIRTIQFGDWDTAWVIRWDDWRQVAAEALLKYEGDIVGHNVVFDLKFITHHLGLPSTRWDWSKIHDTQTMAFLLDPLQSKGLKPLSGRYISARAVGGQEQLEADMRKGKWTWATVPLTLPSYVFYGGLDTILTARLARLFSGQIRERNMVEAYELEQATEGVLFRMILKGLVIDFEYCERTRSRLLSEADEDLAQIRALGVTNPNSRPQLLKQLLADGVVLTERTDSGQLKLDKEVLPFIDHPLAKLVTSYRNKTKWAETYFTNFMQTTNPATGCLHPEVRQFAARTGRMSVTNPAMQTLPRGPLVRDAVIAPEGEKIVAADFSSVEARLFAHFAREQGMIDAIKGGLDFHTYTAQQAYGLGDSLPTKEQRQIAKNTTFCVPTSTRIVTQRGVLSHDEVRVGDRTLGLDELTGSLQWTEVTHVHHVGVQPLVRFGNSRRSYLCTPNHGWIAQKPSGRYYRTTPEEFIPGNDRIILAASIPDSDEDEDAWLWGMLIGDGSIRWRQGNGVEAVITQCKPNFLDRLEANENVRGPRPHGEGCYRFHVAASWVRSMYERLGVPIGVDARDVPLLTSYLQQGYSFLRGLFNGFYAAEGSLDPMTTRWYQDRGPIYEDMLVVSYMVSGRSVRPYPGNGGRDHAMAVSLSRPGLRSTEVTESGEGEVWCVTTTLGSWSAVDLDDQVFLTGNCLIYGGGPAKIAKTAGITEAEARGFVDRYERAFPGFRRFQKEIVDTARRRARDTGRPYIETHLGTRLYVPDADEAYKLTNYIIQGSARIVLADRMVALDNADVMQYAQLVVHDEVDFRIPDDIVDDVRHVIGEVMADRHTFLVDLDADVSPPAQRWGEAK